MPNPTALSAILRDLSQSDLAAFARGLAAGVSDAAADAPAAGASDPCPYAPEQIAHRAAVISDLLTPLAEAMRNIAKGHGIQALIALEHPTGPARMHMAVSAVVDSRYASAALRAAVSLIQHGVPGDSGYAAPARRGGPET